MLFLIDHCVGNHRTYRMDYMAHSNDSLVDILQEAAFKSGDRSAIKKAKYDVLKTIKQAKRRYCDKSEDDIFVTDSREIWKDFNKITEYKPKSKSVPTDDDKLPDHLNRFYARFDRPVNIPPVGESLPPPFEVSRETTRRVMGKLNVRKAPGTDEISPRLLRSCKNEQRGIFSEIYN